MNVPDVNLLLYAANEESEFHERALSWWEEQMNLGHPIALAWITVLAYVRITTHPRAEKRLSIKEAIADVGDWLKRPNIRMAIPGPRHWEILSGLLEQLEISGNSTTDALLAAISIEHGWTLCSADQGFEKYPGLKWLNPLRVSS
jgi:toxin-antitoxin system PIN domain toxin